MKFLIACFLMSLAFPLFSVHSPHQQNAIPTLDVSAVRYVSCDEWMGSGYLIGKGILVTDEHVASGTDCQDVMTGKPLRTYKVDVDHDLALMTGDLPDIPPLKISCQRMSQKQSYFAYGISPFGFNYPLLREVTLTPKGHQDVKYGDVGTVKNQAVTDGSIVPGMSGGPVVDSEGYVHGNVEGGLLDNFQYPVGQSYVTELQDTILCH